MSESQSQPKKKTPKGVKIVIAGFVMADGFDGAVQLSVVDGCSEHTVPTVAHSLCVHSGTPAQFCSDRNLSDPFGFAGKEARGLVLVDHHNRRSKPAGCVVNPLAKFSVLRGMVARAERKSCNVAS